jgi:hypothetical protein
VQSGKPTPNLRLAADEWPMARPIYTYVLPIRLALAFAFRQKVPELTIAHGDAAEVILDNLSMGGRFSHRRVGGRASSWYSGRSCATRSRPNFQSKQPTKFDIVVNLTTAKAISILIATEQPYSRSGAFAESPRSAEYSRRSPFDKRNLLCLGFGIERGSGVGGCGTKTDPYAKGLRKHACAFQQCAAVQRAGYHILFGSPMNLHGTWRLRYHLLLLGSIICLSGLYCPIRRGVIVAS